jgi:cytochrome c oxidase subunit 5b
MSDPIIVKAAGDEQYVGCTGCPADSHNVIWLTVRKDIFPQIERQHFLYMFLQVSRKRPIERCGECGNVIKMEYVGPDDHGRKSSPTQMHPSLLSGVC